MKIDEARAWLRGERSLTNIVPEHPIETWQSRVAEADAALTQQAYWIAKANSDGVLPEATTRPVEYYEWERDKETKQLVKVCKGEGVFHQWGVEAEELETNAANYSTAIIELPDGTVVTPLAHLIKFLDRPAPEEEKETSDVKEG